MENWQEIEDTSSDLHMFVFSIVIRLFSRFSNPGMDPHHEKTLWNLATTKADAGNVCARWKMARVVVWRRDSRHGCPPCSFFGEAYQKTLVEHLWEKDPCIYGVFTYTLPTLYLHLYGKCHVQCILWVWSLQIFGSSSRKFPNSPLKKLLFFFFPMYITH